MKTKQQEICTKKVGDDCYNDKGILFYTDKTGEVKIGDTLYIKKINGIIKSVHLNGFLYN